MRTAAPTSSDHPHEPLREQSAAHLGDPASPLADVLTVDELATLLRVERKTVYGAIARGEIPGVRRIGAILRVSREAVLAWLAQGQGRVSRSRKLQ